MSPFTAELLRIARMLGAFERSAVCCGQVTVPQCLLLRDLLATEVAGDPPLDLASLAASGGASPSATTRLVDGLVRRGWVARERDPADRRRVCAVLTGEGRAEATRLAELTDAGVRQVLGLVPEEEQEALLHSLRVVRRALERAAAANRGSCCGDGGQGPPGSGGNPRACRPTGAG